MSYDEFTRLEAKLRRGRPLNPHTERRALTLEIARAADARTADLALIDFVAAAEARIRGYELSAAEKAELIASDRDLSAARARSATEQQRYERASKLSVAASELELQEVG